MLWLVDHGSDVRLFIDALFANPASSFFALDVIMTAMTLLVLPSLDQDLSRRQRLQTVERASHLEAAAPARAIERSSSTSRMRLPGFIRFHWWGVSFRRLRWPVLA
jgi:hypothetical protein